MEKTFAPVRLIASLVAAAGLALPAAAQQYESDEWYDQQWEEGWNDEAWDDEAWSDPYDQPGQQQRRQRAQQPRSQQDWEQQQRQQEWRRQQSWQNQQRYQDQRFQPDQQGQQATGRTTTLRGTVEDVRPVRLQGFNQEHTLARLRLDDGRSAVIDLGPSIDPSEIQRNINDTIAVRGRQGTINGRSIVFVSELRTRDDTRRISWGGMQQQQQQQFQQQPQQQRQTRMNRLYGSESNLGSMNADQVIANWPDAARRAAEEIIQKYGQPDGVTDQALTWHNNGPWEKTIVSAEPVQHNFPEPHEDVLMQVVKIDVPADKFDDLAEFDGSLVANRTAGELAAICHTEGANILALNLAHQIINDQISVEEAKQQLAQEAQQLKQGRRSQLTSGLTFQPEQQAGDPDQRYRGGR